MPKNDLSTVEVDIIDKIEIKNKTRLFQSIEGENK